MNLPFVTDGGALLPWARSWWLYVSVLFVDALALPMASTLYVAAMGNVYSPALVAVAGAAATTLGSLAQYAIVRRVMRAGVAQRGAVLKLRVRIERAVAAAPAATTTALFVVYATPLSAGPLRLIAAVSGFPVWRFALAIGLGCLPYYFTLALLGHMVRLPLWLLIPAVLLAGVIGVVHLARSWRASGIAESEHHRAPRDTDGSDDG